MVSQYFARSFRNIVNAGGVRDHHVESRAAIGARREECASMTNM